MTPCGTVGYTAPEIVKDEKYSKSVDMWALGCVLYTLLCGFPPFYDESIQVLTQKVARGQYTFLSPWWDDISKSAQDLVSHLLTVDPDKRYSIKEFLHHPWIRQTNEETYPAADAPPLATPLATRLREENLHTGGVDQAPHETPPQFGPPSAVADRRMDFRSPGAVNLREVFDVGYAVHRQEEEGKRRKNFRQGYRGGVNALNEDTDDDEFVYQNLGPDDPPSKIPKAAQPATDVAAMEAKLRSTNLGPQMSSAAQARQAAGGRTHARQQPQQQGGYGQHSAAVAAIGRQTAAKAAKKPFELSMDHATLLERRTRRQGQVSVA